MADEDFDHFLTKFPLSIPGPACTDEHVGAYTGLVPDCLVSYWQEFGFSGFGDGLLWLVDPIEWRLTTNEILLDTIRHPRLDADAQYIPFARNAFGKVWFWTPGYGLSLVVEPVRGTVFFGASAPRTTPEGLSGALKAFFATAKKPGLDFLDKNEDPMFDRVYAHLGALQFDELYGFAPGLRIGGAAIVEATHLFQIHVHMALLRSVIGDHWYVAG
ncbi:GAD-like domain-containing protein [Mycobacteroides abscessus]|uniref:GAD-like domain-containing protein n=1 Tax=Mycobacteroides abscessus TaxID=36809 RepID=UPI00092645B8|nr:GAD-like domain-containing protein [Mycobacteroides abscessus]SKS22392.1 GAD-like domain-containing protein [Mycobacteroides abscessus subsp. abscessus]SHU79912.1 GAD-like domain-containing protein [Mycobacteroides abscessus subsp. bolletii]SHW12564.1 GAD-like domain-containing protein [Mycobacteroides abscessus subsp. bolletii]SHX87028.1 GAD-like domain-containing protein [Mycobacteroides abscessus subsp. bolletii]SHY41091.1 GAD-like domain-containing protein [Mycobacteroides abscessus sub